MSSLLPAIGGGLARAVMMFAAGYGVDLGNEQAETIANGLLGAGSVIWTVVQKMRTDRKIKQAAATGIIPS